MLRRSFLQEITLNNGTGVIYMLGLYILFIYRKLALQTGVAARERCGCLPGWGASIKNMPWSWIMGSAGSNIWHLAEVDPRWDPIYTCKRLVSGYHLGGGKKPVNAAVNVHGMHFDTGRRGPHVEGVGFQPGMNAIYAVWPHPRYSGIFPLYKGSLRKKATEVEPIQSATSQEGLQIMC